MAQTKREENVILVGKKPPMNYVLAVVMQFNSGANEVVIKARGRAISKAVDVAEIVRQRFLPEMVEVKDVKIGSEEVGEEQNKRTVSTIDITLRRVS